MSRLESIPFTATRLPGVELNVNAILSNTTYIPDNPESPNDPQAEQPFLTEIVCWLYTNNEEDITVSTQSSWKMWNNVLPIKNFVIGYKKNDNPYPPVLWSIAIPHQRPAFLQMTRIEIDDPDRYGTGRRGGQSIGAASMGSIKPSY